MSADAYAYTSGNPMNVGDLCLIGHRQGVWRIYHLGTFTNGRRYASLMQGQRRTAASVDKLTLCRPIAAHAHVAEATR